MRKIRKGFNGLDLPSLKYEFPISTKTWTSLNPINLSGYPKLASLNYSSKPFSNWDAFIDNPGLPKPKSLDLIFWDTFNLSLKQSFFLSKTGQALKNAGVSAVSSILSDKFTLQLNLFGDSEVGQTLGGLFSQGVNAATNTIGNNLMRGVSLAEGLGKNISSSLAGAGAGIAANYIGQGINALGGDSMLSRGIGQGVATGLGQIGGQTLSNLVAGKGATNALVDSIKTLKGTTQAAGGLSKAAAIGNLAGLGSSVVGTGLQAALGSSKEYGGTYGSITQGLDTAYDLAQMGVGFVPGVGTAISGAMALNKGLSNVFGSTDGMCVCAGTKVYTASGEVINIEDLVQNLGIIGWNEDTHKIRPNTIKGIVEPRQKECLEIELKNGIILRCSIDHPILSNNKPKAETHRIDGKRIAYRDWKFRRADELKVGDFVGLANNIDYWGTEEMPNAYLVGMLIGDGTYTYENSCRLCSVDPSTWKYIEENNLGVINNCSGTNPNKYTTEYRTYRIINGMQLMKDLGIAYLSSTNKTFPKNLGKYNKDSICKMIAGLYDTDGSISVNEEKGTYKITFYLSNLNLLYDLRDLLHKLGIFSTIYTRKASVNKLANGKIINSNLSYRLEITDMYSANNFYKNIPLNIDYKKEHLKRIHQMLLNKKPLEHNELSGAKQYKIVSIKPIGVLTVYNLEATEDHTYIANGIITHNTKTDAILGSAFMPFVVKWANMWGSSKTGTFDNLSWLNSEKANSFMGDAFGNLNDRFDQARREAGKTYGTFSLGAKKDALRNINFANYAWKKVLNMADLNTLLNIKSQDMASINNQRYALMILGGYSPLAIGRQGMKIFNNATNHNIGMRLLSGAALIDNKQMILSAQGGTKVTRPPRMRAHRKGDESRGLTPEEQKWWKLYEEEQKRQQEEKTARKIKEKEEAADKFNQQANIVMGAMTQQANEIPFTGLEYQQAAENLRQEKVEKFHEAEKIGEAAMMADLAVSTAPLLLRGFRWVLNKAGLLIKVPVQKTIQLKSGIIKSVLDNGKIRLSLPSHTNNKPRQFVLEPARDAGDNKYYVHMRMWDDIENKVPASNVTKEEKQQLFDALYDELPEGAEILFPKSGPGNYGTRGTVVGLQRLSRDPRFIPGTKGTLQYLDKDGKTVKTYEGTSFIKTENGWQGNRYVQDLTTLEGILNFIDNDIIPRILAQGHNVSSYTPTFRQFSPKTDALDEAMSKANSGSGAWFTPASNDITIRGPLEKQDFGLTIHEAGGHGLRYNMLSDYVPTKRDYLNEYIITGGKDMSNESANALSKVHTGDQIYNVIEAQKLRESYPWIKTYFERNPVKKSGDVVLRESGSVNTQFRSHYSNNGKIVGKELDEVVDKASPGVVLRDLIEQPYTSSIIDDIAKITGKDPDALLFYGPEILEKLVNSYPKLLEIVSKVKDTMKTVGNYGIPITVEGSTAATLYNTNK